MLTRRATACSISCSQSVLVCLQPFRRSSLLEWPQQPKIAKITDNTLFLEFRVVQGLQCWYPLKTRQQFLLLQAASLLPTFIRCNRTWWHGTTLWLIEWLIMWYTPCLNKNVSLLFFLYNSVQCRSILIIFSMQHREETWRSQCILAYLTLILLLHYLVKCRSRSLTVYNDAFILGSAYVCSKYHWYLKIIENRLLI